MNKIFTKAFLSLIVVILTLSSCKKDPEPDPKPNPIPTPTTGDFMLEFQARFGNTNMIFGNQFYYVTSFGDSLQFKTLKYYITNIKLIGEDVPDFAEPESYHLVENDINKNTLLTIKNVPVGNYKGVEFMIGVDSTRNVSGAQTGALDPANGMFWSWNTGYIFFKVEGTYTKNTVRNNLVYHIGGFKNPFNAIQTTELFFPNGSEKVDGVKTRVAHFYFNFNEMFAGDQGRFDLENIPTEMTISNTAVSIANRFKTSLTLSHTHDYE